MCSNGEPTKDIFLNLKGEQQTSVGFLLLKLVNIFNTHNVVTSRQGDQLLRFSEKLLLLILFCIGQVSKNKS